MTPETSPAAAIENIKELIAELDRFKKEGRALEHSPMAYFLANNAKVLIQQLEVCQNFEAKKFPELEDDSFDAGYELAVKDLKEALSLS